MQHWDIMKVSDAAACNQWQASGDLKELEALLHAAEAEVSKMFRGRREFWTKGPQHDALGGSLSLGVTNASCVECSDISKMLDVSQRGTTV